MAEQTLNLPQLIAVVLVGFVVLRWIFSSSSTSAASRNPVPSGRTGNAGRRVDPTHVEILAQMFPQVGTREIMWDLQRNGGNPGATTERILSGRGLETPPISFQPLSTSNARPSSSSTPTGAARNSKPSTPDLITRYNLSSKLSSTSSVSTSPDQSSPLAGKQAWSQNKAERSQLLQRRREEMILAARRKMEEKDRLAAKGSA